MKPDHIKLLVTFLATMFINCYNFDSGWITEKHKGYNLIFTAPDKANSQEYSALVKNGILHVRSFFGDPYKRSFDVFIHPDRRSLDSTWQQDWKMPAFKSQCWMVASGVAARLDMISPKLWDRFACEHVYADAQKTQQLITHELIHVFHGQLNASPDFSNTEAIDWFVEGLATFASGQLDSQRIAEIKKSISANTVPKELDKFWTGKLRYGLSGSIILYIDNRYGRSMLKKLLPFNKKSDILAALQTTEAGLLESWKEYVQKL